MEMPKYSLPELPEGQGTRGYAVLICNETFRNKKLPYRKGASQDLEYMKQIARQLGLDQLNKEHDKDLDKDEMNKVIDDAAKNVNNTSCDMFLFMISTHGDEQANPRKSGQIDHALMSIDGEFIFVSDLVEKFNDKYCELLAGKPKLFFFQACRVINHFLYMEHHSEMHFDGKSGQLKLKDKEHIHWTPHHNDHPNFSERIANIDRVESSKTKDTLKAKEFEIIWLNRTASCSFTAETDSAVNYWVVGLTQLILPGKPYKKLHRNFLKVSSEVKSGLLSICKPFLYWQTPEHDLGKIDLQGIRAGKSRFPPEFREKYAENRCFSVAHKVMDKKYTWQHFVAGDNVPLEDVPIWIKEITYMIHDNKIGVDEGISVTVADTETGVQGVTVVPHDAEADIMDTTESDAIGGHDSITHKSMDKFEESPLPQLPKRYEPAEQLLVNVNPRKPLPFHPHALAPVYKCYNDMLIMTSSPSGMLAWRSSTGKKAGSWMIRFIKEEIEKSTEKEIFLTKVLTKVAYDMANQETKVKNHVHHGMKSVCVVDHQLLKALIFSKCA